MIFVFLYPNKCNCILFRYKADKLKKKKRRKRVKELNHSTIFYLRII